MRLSSASLHCVRPISNGYRMYFSSQAAFSVYSATSADGENWTVEPGVRISTELAGFYSSSITALGAFEGATVASGPYRAYYVGLSSTGIYSVLSATSTDGLAWGRDPDFLLQPGGGTQRVVSLAPYFISSLGRASLYYVRDDGSRDPASHRVYLATSTDSGNSFSGEIQVLSSTGVFHVAISTLTNGTFRLFASATLGAGATAAIVLAADSADGYAARTTVFSTAPASNALGGIAVLRSTDTFSWRLYFTSTLNQAATSYVYSALTRSPVVTGFTPNLVYDNDGPTSFTVYGEIFAPGLNTAALAGAPGVIPVTLVTRVSDTQLTVATTPLGAALGLYSVSVTNPGGRSAGLSNVLRVDFRPGFTVLTDNLFRPLRGEQVTVAATIYKAGDLKMDIYTINGGLVRRLFSGPVAVGTKTRFWDGKTDGGRTAASGLYLLHVTGPKLNGTEKIVLIK